MSKTAGYATTDNLVEELRKVAPERREATLRQWIGGRRTEKEKFVAQIMAKLKAREMH